MGSCVPASPGHSASADFLKGNRLAGLSSCLGPRLWGVLWSARLGGVTRASTAVAGGRLDPPNLAGWSGEGTPPQRLLRACSSRQGGQREEGSALAAPASVRSPASPPSSLPPASPLAAWPRYLLRPPSPAAFVCPSCDSHTRRHARGGGVWSASERLRGCLPQGVATPAGGLCAFGGVGGRGSRLPGRRPAATWRAPAPVGLFFLLGAPLSSCGVPQDGT